MGTFKELLEDKLNQLNLQNWKEYLKHIELIDDEDDLKFKYTDNRFRVLLDKDGKELLKGMKIFDKVLKKENTGIEKRTFESYELQRIAVETVKLPRGDFKGKVSFLDYFDVADNLKPDSLEYWIDKIINGEKKIKNDGHLNLYVFSSGLSFYIFDTGGMHKTYASILLAPLVEKFTTEFYKIYVDKGEYFDISIQILEKYHYIKELYKREEFNIKIKPLSFGYNVIIYSNDSDKCLFLNVSTSDFNKLCDFLEKNRFSLIFKAKRVKISEKIQKHFFGRLLNPIIEPMTGTNYRHNYRLSIEEKKYYVKD